MVDTFEAKVIQDFARDIAVKLNEAAVIARMADGFGQQGLPDRAFKTLLGVETLIHDASILLNATSVVRRREHGDGGDMSD